MKLFLSKKQKLLAWILSLIALLVLFFYISIQVAINKINQNHDEIQTLLNQSLGMPVTFKKIKTHWVGISLAVALKDVVIYDKDKPVPFVSIGTLELRSSVFNLLMQRKLDFDSVSVQKLILVLGKDKDNNLTLLGLKGESLPEGFDFEYFFKMLRGKEVKIKQAAIHWRNEGSMIVQYVRGVLKSDAKTENLTFEGKQRISFGDKDRSGFVFLRSNIKFSFNPHNKFTQLTMQLSRLFQAKPQASLSCLLNEKQILNCEFLANNVDVSPLHQQILLKPEDPAWLRYLLFAFEKGKINDANVSVQGPLEDLSWEGHIAYQDVNFQYAKDFPKIQKANGSITIYKDIVKVQMNNGQISGAQINQAYATIGPFNTSGASTKVNSLNKANESKTGKTEPMSVMVKGKVAGSLIQGLQFLQQSPLRKTIAKKIAALDPKGPFSLNLYLMVPIQDQDRNKNQDKKEMKPSIEVEGQLHTENATLQVPVLNLPINDLKGDFYFTESEVHSDNIQAKILNAPFMGTVSPEAVSMEGQIAVDYLKNQFASPFWKFLKGKSIFKVSNYSEDGRFQIESDLKGVTIDLPSPIGKTIEEKRPIAITVFPKVKEEVKISVKMEEVFDAKVLLAQNAGQYQLKRGQLVFGRKTADWITKNHFMINGEIPVLNLENWWRVVENQSLDIYRVPLDVYLLAETLDLMDLSFQKTWVYYNSSKKGLLGFEGKEIQGKFYFPTQTQPMMSFELDHLTIKENKEKDNKTKEKSQTKTYFLDNLKNQEKTQLLFLTKNLTYHGKNFGEVAFQLAPKSTGYNIQDLSVRTEAYTLEGKGEWVLKGEERTKVDGAIYCEDFGQSLAQWGFSSMLKEGKGRLQFTLAWPGSPFDFSLSSLNGSMNINLRNGRIMGVNPGFGRIISFITKLNPLEHIQSGKVDFSDVYKQGFAFNNLMSTLYFRKGEALTDALTIEGPTASIKIRGRTNLATKDLDFNMAVSPKLGAGISLAAGLLGGPVAGFGAFVVNKLVSNKMGSFTQYNYKISGTWDSPNIQKN